ncbi:hypothetical protein HTZ97_06645 [Desulfuromonas acetoxidans]|uniref:Uncharacterized protein n=1 Tax=Desulfuromonas acetoxidans (strain DSM 684 / 11070) TaxID=281689 RepID=Q1K1Q1_DESA6|nr:hypothetical protein [Desulfuromonas acetoxidans]EAT16337.1 hypothetical protein Dace_1801 [Desulfuromonas acetoxidans DSM 684]MBF0645986.1 hypothetical protein [Desulfuromonas acetoxidans]NVD23476.1 hypothetical protein [Desulfuromonas acetoxidans]NVE16138.1 hypothetical protein [Desulfuromonas acetoxidans]
MIRILVTILLAMGLSFPCSSMATSPASSVVHYDEQHDLLDIKATQASLQNLCSRISDATGVIFDLSPEAEQQISFNSSQKSVEETLKDLMVSTHLSHMFVYATKSGKTRLYQVKILARTFDSGNQHSTQQTPMTTEQRRQFLAELKEKREKKFEQAMLKPTSFENNAPPQPVIPQPPSMPNEHQGLIFPRWNSKNPPIDFKMQPTREQGDNQ